MPHIPDTHVTITPKHVHINGKPVSVTGHGIKLSDPDPTGIQTVTLTIFPTTVTILNDDNPDTINAAHEAVTRHTRDETGSANQNVYQVNCTREAYDEWKRLIQAHKMRMDNQIMST